MAFCNNSSGYQGLVEFVALVNVQKHISVMFIIKFHMVLISYLSSHEIKTTVKISVTNL